MNKAFHSFYGIYARICIRQCEKIHIGFIMDRWLFSESIIRELRKPNMHYIFKLKLNPTIAPNKANFVSAFSDEEFEKLFYTIKGDLESNKSYLRSNEKVKGFFSIIFLSLRIRFKILKVLKNQNPLKKMSVDEINFELSNMERIVEKSGTEYFAVVPQRVEKFADLFRDMISIG